MSDTAKYKKLVKNSAIFLVGNMGSKLIAFFIVPFYTYVLTTEEYGTADLITTTVNLLTPFVMFGMNEALLRFTAGQEDSMHSLTSNALAIVVSGAAVSWLLYPLLSSISILSGNVVYLLILLNLQAFTHVYLQLLKGMGDSASFAVNGVLTTFVMAAANIVALAVLQLGVAGYLMSMIVAQVASALHIIIASKLWRYIAVKYIDRRLLKQMLAYCVPLIPNALMWWIMSASSRYVILFFMDPGANGIYNVAYKIPTIVNTVYVIFMQAWQLSAIEERNSEDNARFQSTVFRYVFVILAVASSLIAASAYPVNAFLMSSAYEGAWQPVALLAFANFLFCIGSFFGTAYTVTKETKRAFLTTALGAVVNLVLTVASVPFFGIMGASAAAVVSYAVVMVARKRDMDKFVRVDYVKSEIIPAIVILVAQVCISFFPYSPALVGVSFALFAVLLVFLRDCLLKITRMTARIISGRLKRKKNDEVE